MYDERNKDNYIIHINGYRSYGNGRRTIKRNNR